MSPSSAPTDGGDASLARARRIRRPLPVLICALLATILAAALSRGRDTNPGMPGSAALPGIGAAFVRAGIQPAGAGPNMLAAVDLDRDGDLDLVTTNLRGQDAVAVLENTGDGTFTHPASTSVPGIVDPGRFAITDLDSDGQLDLVIPGETSGNLVFLRNAGGGRMAPPELLALPSPTPAQAVAGDLDGDGREEIVVAHLGGSDQLSVVEGSRAAPWGDRTVHRLEVGSDIESLVLIDLDRDGDRDLAAADRTTGVVLLFCNTGGGRFERRGECRAGQSPGFLVSADLNADTRPDLVVINEGSNDVSVLLAAGDFAFEEPAAIPVGDRPTCPALADLDHDSDLDLAVPGRFSDDVTILCNRGDGTFYAGATWVTEPGPTAVAALDLDGDAFPDLAITSAIADCITLWRNSGLGDSESKAAAKREPSVEIVYQLDAPARVRLTVFNSSGVLVRTLVDDMVAPSGRHRVAWDGLSDAGDELPRGTYFYRVATDRTVDLRRTTLF